MLKNVDVFGSVNAKHYIEVESSVRVVPVNDITKITDTDYEKVVAICNQPEVYNNMVFTKRLNEAPYELKHAKGFLSWASKGWESLEYFVFLIRNRENEVIGCIDIKSNDLNNGEIGYWMDGNFPGFMTNVVIALTEAAKKAGYKKLVAYTDPNNEKSQRVVERAGFINAGKILIDGENLVAFEKILDK